jgi:site-specific recombinase XerD
MNNSKANTLGVALRDFFYDYLQRLRGMSPNTVLSYRDAMKLLLRFVADRKKVSVAGLTIEDIGAPEVVAFLDHLEKNRNNGIVTRNMRLAAIHSFFRYLAGRYPEHLDQSQRVLSIPFKRMTIPAVEYLEFEEIVAVLKAIDRTEQHGRRDYALLAIMFNTGARVQEILDLKASDLQLTHPHSVRVHGKGGKERICPIWPETAHVLREYLEEQGIDPRKPATVFANHHGGPLTRFGVRYILSKHIQKAAEVRPSLGRKRLHPHSIRHSTAVHLLKSGVDISTIAHWMGHASINTTNRYTAIDLEMKRNAIARAKPLREENSAQPSWKHNPDIITWLESL